MTPIIIKFASMKKEHDHQVINEKIYYMLFVGYKLSLWVGWAVFMPEGITWIFRNQTIPIYHDLV